MLSVCFINLYLVIIKVSETNLNLTLFLQLKELNLCTYSTWHSTQIKVICQSTFLYFYFIFQVMGKVTVEPSIILIISSLAWFHAVVNPWIYGYLNPQYRKEYKKILNYVKTGIQKKEHSTTVS